MGIDVETRDSPGQTKDSTGTSRARDATEASDATGGDPPAVRRRDGRDRLLRGAVELLGEKGYAGMELRDVAERGEAPRGSIYHHFPGGKVQLAVEAARLEGRRIKAVLEQSVAEQGVRATLAMFGQVFRQRAADYPELIGCPVAAAALARPEDPELAAAATEAFAGWEQAIAKALTDEGVAPEPATAFATLTVSTIEGALLRTRAAADDAPMDAAISGLEQALDALLARQATP